MKTPGEPCHDTYLQRPVSRNPPSQNILSMAQAQPLLVELRHVSTLGDSGTLLSIFLLSLLSLGKIKQPSTLR